MFNKWSFPFWECQRCMKALDVRQQQQQQRWRGRDAPQDFTCLSRFQRGNDCYSVNYWHNLTMMTPKVIQFFMYLYRYIVTRISVFISQFLTSNWYEFVTQYMSFNLQLFSLKIFLLQRKKNWHVIRWEMVSLLIFKIWSSACTWSLN